METSYNSSKRHQTPQNIVHLELPPEIWSMIAEHLSFSDLTCGFWQVSKLFNDIHKRQSYWEPRVSRAYNNKIWSERFIPDYSNIKPAWQCFKVLTFCCSCGKRFTMRNSRHYKFKYNDVPDSCKGLLCSTCYADKALTDFNCKEKSCPICTTLYICSACGVEHFDSVFYESCNRCGLYYCKFALDLTGTCDEKSLSLWNCINCDKSMIEKMDIMTEENKELKNKVKELEEKIRQLERHSQ